MSASENTRLLRLEEVENARLLLDQWTQGLAEVLKSMADQKPEVRWQAVSGPFPETAAPGDRRAVRGQIVLVCHIQKRGAVREALL